MQALVATLKDFLKGLERVETCIAAIGLYTVTILMFAQIVNRYLLHFEIVWFGDLALYLFIFFMLFAATVTTWKDAHVSVDILPTKAFAEKPLAAAYYPVLVRLYVIVVTLVFLSSAYQYMVKAFQYPQYGTLVPWFNTSWLQVTLFIAYSLVLLHVIVLTHRDVSKAVHLTRESKQGDKEAKWKRV